VANVQNPLLAFSVFSTSGNNLAQNTIDRVPATFYASTGATTSEFFQIDLGSSYDVLTIEVVATSGQAIRLSNLTVTGSLNADLSSPVALGSIGASNATATITINGNQSSVRYIRFAKTGGAEIIQIAELRIWGRETGSYTNGATLVIPTAIANPTKPKIVRVLGRSLINDGGGGEFYLDSNDVDSLEDGGITFIAANGDRWKRVIEEDFVNVRWWGAEHCTNVADPDQSPAFTAALRGAAFYSYGRQSGNGTISWNKAMKVIIPPGTYIIRKAIRMPKSLFGTRTTGTHRLIIEGNGRVELQWRGDSTASVALDDQAVILFENYYYSAMRDVFITAYTPLQYGILLLNNGGNPTATGISLKNIIIQGIGTAYIYGSKVIKVGVGFPANGTGGDANNDLPTVSEVTVDSAHIAFFGYGLNFHDAVFDRCKMASCNWGVNFGNVGYLRWTNGSSGDTKYADFYFRSNSYPSYIIGHNAEHAGRLIDVRNCVAPLYIQGVRYNSQRSFQTYAVVAGSDVNLQLENSLFGFGLARCGVTGFPYGVDAAREFNNTVSVEGCNWLVATPRMFGVGYFDNIFGSPAITVPVGSINTTENSIDFGTGNNVSDGCFFVHNGTTANHGLSAAAGYFVKAVTGTTRFRFYDTYANYLANTHMTLNNLAGITLKLAVPNMTYDETETATDACKFTTIHTEGVQLFPPSHTWNILYDTTKQPDHQPIKEASKSFLINTLVANTTYNVADITTQNQASTFMVSVSWGTKNEVAVFFMTPRPAPSWQKMGAVYSLSELTQPEIYYQSTSTILSMAGVNGLTTSLIIKPKVSGDYKVSVLPIGGSSNYFLRLQPNVSAISGTPTTITDTAILDAIGKAASYSYEKAPLLINPEGNTDSLVTYLPERVSGSGSISLNLSKTNNFIVKPTGALALSAAGIRSGVPYKIDINWGTSASTVSLSSLFKFPSGTATLSNLANTKDSLVCQSSDGVSLDCQLFKAVTNLVPSDVPGLLTYVNANDESTLDLVTNNLGLAGTVSVADASTTVVGTGTSFTTTIAVGESIIISGQERIVMTITSDTDLTIDLPLSAAVTGVTPSRRFYTVQRILDASGLPGGINSDTQATASQRLQLLKKVRGGRNVLAFCRLNTESQNMVWNYTGKSFPARSVIYNGIHRGLRDGKRLFTSPNSDAALFYRSTTGTPVKVNSGATSSTVEKTGFYSNNESIVGGFSINAQGVTKLFKNGSVILQETIAAPTLETTFWLSGTTTGLTIFFSEIYIANTEWTDTQIAAISELSNSRVPTY
jgi:hypothetical protein